MYEHLHNRLFDGFSLLLRQLNLVTKLLDHLRILLNTFDQPSNEIRSHSMLPSYILDQAIWLLRRRDYVCNLVGGQLSAVPLPEFRADAFVSISLLLEIFLCPPFNIVGRLRLLLGSATLIAILIWNVLIWNVSVHLGPFQDGHPDLDSPLGPIS